MSAELERQLRAKAEYLDKRKAMNMAQNGGMKLGKDGAAVLALGVLASRIEADPDRVLATLIQANARDESALGDRWLQAERAAALERLRKSS